MPADFFGAREQEKCRAPFSGEDFVDVTSSGHLRPDAADLMTCTGHRAAAQWATLPWRGMSLYFRHPGQTVWPNAHTGCPSSCQEIRAVCSSDAARWRRGRKKGSSAQGRMAAPLPGDPRPGKVSKVLSVGVSLASVCSSHGARARSSTNGFQPYTVGHRLASDGRRSQ